MSIASIIDRARADGRKLLTEVESKDILEEAGIPTARARLASSADEAAAVSQEMGFPVALKIVSPDITHKSDVGGVKLNVGSAAEAKAAFDEIVAAAKKAEPKARIDGVSVQKMARPGIEVIMGMSQDAQFGPVLMFGLGGVLVEVLKDVLFPAGADNAARRPADGAGDQGPAAARGLSWTGAGRHGRAGEVAAAAIGLRRGAPGDRRAGPEPHLRLQGRRRGRRRARHPILTP